MKSLLMGLLAAAAMAASGAENVLTAQEKAEGWKLLWDGKTASGWQGANSKPFPNHGWVMTNGVLTIGTNSKAGDIVTKEKFTDFTLKADFMLTHAANSGIKYFYDPAVAGGTALEFQVLDGAHPDAARGRNGNRKIGSFYDVIPAVGAHPKALGEWNTAMIVSKGAHVEHWLNGEKVCEFDRGSDAFRAAVKLSKFQKWPNWGETKSGSILLQDHNDCVSYRNIKIKTGK